MSKITNDGLTWSGKDALQLYPYGNCGRQRVNGENELRPNLLQKHLKRTVETGDKEQDSAKWIWIGDHYQELVSELKTIDHITMLQLKFKNTLKT